MSFGCERSCSSPGRVSNFNSKVPQGGIYPYIQFERDRLNIFRVRVFTSSGSIIIIIIILIIYSSNNIIHVHI